MKTVAIITARGSSKRIPHKNIREFCGRPIIEYSIQAALASGAFTEVMVSTEDEQIKTVSEKAGAKVRTTSPRRTKSFMKYSHAMNSKAGTLIDSAAFTRLLSSSHRSVFRMPWLFWTQRNPSCRLLLSLIRRSAALSSEMAAWCAVSPSLHLHALRIWKSSIMTAASSMPAGQTHSCAIKQPMWLT